MKIELMQEFIELARVKNYSRAAENLFISQSTLSKHVAAIEDELGVHLLKHDYRGVELTDMGIYALDVFTQITGAYDMLKLRASEVAGGLHGELRFGVPYYATRTIASPILKKFNELYPAINVTITSGQPDLLHELLLEGKIDIALNMYCRTMEVPNGTSFDIVELMRDKQVFLCSKDNSLANIESISIDALEGKTIRCFESGPLSSAFAQAVRSRFEKKGVHVTWQDPVRNADLLSDAVSEDCDGVIVPKHAARFHPDLSAIILEDMFPCRMALYSEKNNPNPAVTLFRAVATNASKAIRL